jgi:hypothetical protein
MKARIFLPLLLALGVFQFAASAQDATPTPSPSPTPEPTPSPLLVYDLELDKTGRSVNYTFFKDGFLVADPNASSFSTVVVLTDPNTFNFYQVGGFVTGTYNEVRDYAGRRNAVLFGATAGTTASSDNAAIQVVGPIDRHGSVGGGMKADYSNKMRGYFMASGTETETTGNGTVSEFEYGYAGFSKAKADFNKGLTKEVNGQGLDVAGAVTFLENYLSARGIPGPTPTPSPSPTPTPVVE